MKEDADALTEEEIQERIRVRQGRNIPARPDSYEYFKHIERLEVRFVIENVNKPFMPVDVREERNKNGLWTKHEGEFVKSADIKATIGFEAGTAPADGNTQELTDIFIEHMWNFVREVKGYGRTIDNPAPRGVHPGAMKDDDTAKNC